MTSVLILLSGFDPGTYVIEDNGDPTDGIAQLRSPDGSVILFNIPTEFLTVTASAGRDLVINLTESFGAADITVGSLTDSTQNPDSITVANIRGAGDVTLVSNGAITELGSDAAADIQASTLILSAATGVGAGANAIETQVGTLEAETTTGGITLSNTGNVVIGGLTDDVAGLDVETSGNLTLTNLGTISLNDETAFESVHGGNTSGSVTLTANGANSDIISLVDQDAIAAAGGNVTLTAGRDVSLGTQGLNFDNDVRARNNLTINVGRDLNIDGFADLASDGFGAGTGGDVVVNAGRDINVLNATGTDGSLGAEGSAGGNTVLNAGPGGFVRLLASSTSTLFSSSGNVTVNADRMNISATAGITASSGVVTLRPATDGWAVDLGSVVDGAFALELSDAELNRIFTPTLTVGSTSAGLVRVTSALTPLGLQNLALIGGTDISVEAAITVIQALTLTAGDNLLHTGGAISATTITAQVDDAGDDEETGGFGAFGSVSGTTITLSGKADADVLKGAEGVDQTVHGNGGNDVITSNGEGQYFGDGGNDTVFAGLSSGLVNEVLDGGNGVDTVDTTSFSGSYVINLANGVTNFGFESFVNFENVTTAGGADSITGTSGANIIRTGAGIDVLNGGAGNDTLIGGADDDEYRVDAAGDVVTELFNDGTDLVRASADYVLSDNVENLALSGGARAGTGNGIANLILGSGGEDVLSGLAGDDTLRGRGARDTLLGGDGEDLLDGGVGKDTMTGGADRDVFQFRDGDFGPSRALADVITDFRRVDNEKMNLSLVDADTVTGGNQAFAFIGTGAFTGVAGQLRFAQQGGNTFVEGDTDGNGVADVFITLTGTINLAATDFVL